MEQANLSLSLQCPDHGLAIGMLSTDLNAKKIGYCDECIAENGEDATFLQTLKTVSNYLKDTSSFYEKCRQRVSHAGQPPANFLEELSKKEERLEKLSRHIDEEKDKIKKSFEEIRKNVMQIINKKEKEFLELLDKEISCLSGAYLWLEKIVTARWPEPSEIQNVYPDVGSLEQGMSKIQDMNQLQVFMQATQQDMQLKSSWGLQEDDSNRIKKAVDGLIRDLNILGSYQPKIRADFLDFENLKSLTRDLMKGFIQQETRVENSIVAKIGRRGSKIIADEKFQILRDWLPEGYKFELRLLFRSSVDGKSAKVFHQKCDGKGATITLMKCQFEGALSDSIIGGFLDQSWHSNGRYGSSIKAFLFSLGDQRSSSVKCSISEPRYAFYGDPQFGPTFGQYFDIMVGGQLQTGLMRPGSYSNSVVLSSNPKSQKFTIAEIEVFQVQ